MIDFLLVLGIVVAVALVGAYTWLLNLQAHVDRITSYLVDEDREERWTMV